MPSPPWVIVASGIHPHGGMEKANTALAEHLHARGTPLHLVAHSVDPAWDERRGVLVHRVERPLGADFLGQFPLGRRGREVATEVTSRFPGARVVVNGGNLAWPDVNWVHTVHHAWHPRDEAAPAWFRLKNRLVKGHNRRGERRALRAARVVIANSERTGREVVELLGVDPSRVRAVYLGADPAWAPPGPEERAEARARLGVPEGVPLVVFVGALSHDRNKGLDTLWAAWERLRAEGGWDARLLVAGGGSGVARWRERVAAAGASEEVRLLGFTDRIPELLAAADLLVSPARYEAYGLNVQEAICRGVPALASSRAGVTERFPPELRDLILPDPEDAVDLAARLRAWRGAMEAWRVRILPFSGTLRGYTWDEMARRIVAAAG